MNPNTVNQFLKGSIIYTQGETVFSVGMIVKGRILIQSNGYKMIAGSGAFLGINDLYLGKYQSTYIALDDVLLYPYPISKIEELESILNTNKDYHGFMVASYYKMISDLDQIYQELLRCSSTLYQFLKEYYQRYQALAVRRGLSVKVSKRIEELEPIDSELELISDRIRYYIECRSIPIEAIKQFYSYGNMVTQLQIEDEVNVVNQQIESLQEMYDYFTALTGCLVDDSESCLFRLFADVSLSAIGIPGVNDEIMDIMDDIITHVNTAESLADRMLGRTFKVDRKRMEEIYHLLLTNNKGETENPETLLNYSKEAAQKALEETQDSFAKIVEYAGFKGKAAEEMISDMQTFILLKDKFSTEDSARGLRRKLAENHYNIYFRAFLRAYKEKRPPRIVDMFLKYGYADERLLTKEQLLSLYYLKDGEENQEQCKVYNIKEWLILIYEGKKEPSKNEFDLEFSEMVTNLRKQGKLTEKDAQQWMTDSLKKLEYEIQNMFRYNNRTTNGQISSFVPFLYKEQLTNNIGKIYITARKVNEAINKIMRVDYSVFDREVIYSNQEKKIVKEYIIKRVFPDIILMPTFGSNGVMWQEISGRRRDNAGRFLLPIFAENNLEQILIRVLGRFRWELCRTIEGAAWNDIQHKSLTSEYSDYLQFYRKNKDLSEEKKEKLKLQIQKGRNNSREIFVIDYEQWINYEAMGAIKLNKPVREMLSTYCPFSKEIREQVKLQPLFEEAMARYYREKQKKVREIEGRHRLLQKENIEIPQELLDTLSYYRDL
jgi:CRP-like cAMP-binding protein